MSRKVLISFLGTGNYFPVYYTCKDKKGKEKRITNHQTRFVQEAIVTNICKDWTENDCIMVFRTAESNTANWVDRTTTGASGEDITIPGLKSTLENIRFHNGKGMQCRVNPDKEGDDSYMIPMGLEVDELDNIFQCVYDKLKDGDEIYFDVTHAFRTIPLFATTLFNYARFLKSTTVKGIYYGAFEKLGPVYLLNKLPDDKKKELSAPIADLTNIVRLQEINNAASSYHDFGNMSAFSRLMLGERELDDDIHRISCALEDLDTYMRTSQLKAIEDGTFMADIIFGVENFCNSPFTTEAQRTLLKKISSQLEEFGFAPECSYGNIEAAIDRAIHYKMIQQAYTMVKEYIVTRVYDLMDDQNIINGFVRDLKISKDRNFDYKVREKIGSVITNNPEVVEKSAIVREFRANNPEIEEIRRHYSNISRNRNHLNHGSLYGKEESELLESLKKDWAECKNIFRNNA